MHNPILDQCVKYFDSGLNIKSINAKNNGNKVWTITLSISNYFPLGEGGELPQHIIKIDYKSIPNGVSCSGFDRHPDITWDIYNKTEAEIRDMIDDIARRTKALDWAKIGDTFATKPGTLNRIITNDKR